MSSPLHLGEISSEAVAFWETDEEDPTYFNDGASWPSEGVSARHSLGAINATFGGLDRSVALLEQADAFILKHQAEVAAATSPTPSALIDPVPRAPR